MLVPCLLVLPAALLPSDAGAAAARSAEGLRLAAIRQAARDGMVISETESQRIAAVGGEDAWKYGEVTPRGFSTLAKALQLGEDDAFFDAGSGLGRLVLQAARDFGVRRSCGIELSQKRHAFALQSLKSESADVSSRITLLEGDCADPSLWDAHLADCSVVFL